VGEWLTKHQSSIKEESENTQVSLLGQGGYRVVKYGLPFTDLEGYVYAQKYVVWEKWQHSQTSVKQQPLRLKKSGHCSAMVVIQRLLLNNNIQFGKLGDQAGRC
jgi:hypothetical protein